VRLPDLHGGASIWPEARRQLDGTPAEAQLLELQALWQSASDAELAPVVLADLGETRELEYYTGPVFQLLAHGPGEPVASGGRYDALYRRFGAPSPAAGVALDLNHLCWALHSAGVTHSAPSRIAVASEVPRELVATLRARGLRSAASEEPRAYASHWGYDFVLERNGGLRLTHLPSNAGLDLVGDATETLAGTIAGFIDRAGSDRI
jgi:ATP phosphoribosyltransferase regulatory subunit